MGQSQPELSHSTSAGALLLWGRKTSLKRVALSIPMLVLVALSHQLVAVVAVSIILAEALHLGINRKKPIIMLLLTSLVAFILLLNPMLSISRLAKTLEQVFVSTSGAGGQAAEALKQGTVATWYLLPASILGFFRENRLSTWLASSGGVFLFSLAVPNPSPIVPGRWITYATIPLLFYAINTIALAKRTRIISLICLLALTSTGVGMIIPDGTPVTREMHALYPEFPATLVSSTAKREHVNAILVFSDYLNSKDSDGCLVTHYP